MFNQPSVNQLAQTFLGNPAPLQAKVQQEQQAAPNLPPDLAQLMALQQIQETRDAAQRQQAMSQGTPPTVAQQLQQAVRPQQPQGLMAGMGNAPMRPQQAGIDQLPSNFGHGMAGGGIVAFAKGDLVGGDIGAQLDRETEELGLGKRTEYSPAVQAYVTQKEQKSNAEQNAYLQQEVARQLQGNPMMQQRGISSMATMPTADYRRGDPRALASMPSAAEQLTQASSESPASETVPPARNLRDLASQQPERPRQGIDQLMPPAARPARVAAAPVAQPAVQPVAPVQSEAEKIYAAGMQLNPEERQRKAEEALRSIGGEDQTARQRYIAELEARRAQFKKPEAGYAGLMDLLGNIAQSKGRTWMAAGAEGAQRQKENEAAMAQKDIETLKEIMGETTKMGESSRQFKLSTYAAGQKAYEEAYKERFEAAKAQGLTDNESKRLAQQAAEHAKTLASQETIARLSREAAAARASQLSPEASLAERKEQEWLKLNPGKTSMDYMREVASAKQGTAPQSKQAALVERYSEAWNKKSMSDKMALAEKGITEQDWIRQQMSLAGATPSPATSVQPLPATKEALITGNIYQTSKGPAKWNGSGFTSI